MTPTTPSGVATRSIRRPLGRTKVASTRPTGSGSRATSSTPLAIASMRVGSSASRSRKAGLRPFAPASARSSALATRISADRSRKARAAAASAWFFCLARRIGQSARRRARLGADRAHCGADVRFGLADLNGGGHGPFPKSRPRIPGGPSEGHSFRLRRPRSLLTPSAGRPCRIAGSSPDGRRRSGRYNRGPRRKPHRGRCESRRACPAG